MRERKKFGEGRDDSPAPRRGPLQDQDLTRQERVRRKIEALPQDAAGSSEDDVAGVEDSGGGGVGRARAPHLISALILEGEAVVAGQL